MGLQAAVLKVRPRRAAKGPVAPPRKAPSPRSDLVRESSVHSRLPTTVVEHGRSTVLLAHGGPALSSLHPAELLSQVDSLLRLALLRRRRAERRDRATTQRVRHP